MSTLEKQLFKDRPLSIAQGEVSGHSYIKQRKSPDGATEMYGGFDLILSHEDYEHA